MKFSIATALSITAMAASASANPIFADAETAASFDKRDLPLIFKFMIDGDTQGYLSELPNGMGKSTCWKSYLLRGIELTDSRGSPCDGR